MRIAPMILQELCHHLYIQSLWNHAMVQNLDFLVRQKTEIRFTLQ